MKKVGNWGNLEAPAKWKKLEHRMAKVIANHALNHFLEGFEQGGGKTDAGFWKKRKKGFEMKKRGKSIGGVPRSVISDRALLVQSGTLRNSMQVISDIPERIEIGTKGVRYAAIHNFGLNGKAWGKHPFTMPKREFVGKSTELNLWVVRHLETQIGIHFKQ